MTQCVCQSHASQTMGHGPLGDSPEHHIRKRERVKQPFVHAAKGSLLHSVLQRSQSFALAHSSPPGCLLFESTGKQAGNHRLRDSSKMHGMCACLSCLSGTVFWFQRRCLSMEQVSSSWLLSSLFQILLLVSLLPLHFCTLSFLILTGVLQNIFQLWEGLQEREFTFTAMTQSGPSHPSNHAFKTQGFLSSAEDNFPTPKGNRRDESQICILCPQLPLLNAV